MGTSALEAVWADLVTHDTAAVAVIGQRGTGKTTLVEAVEARCAGRSREAAQDPRSGRPGLVASLRLIVPGDYSAPDFLAYLTRAVAQAVRAQVERAKPWRGLRSGEADRSSLVIMAVWLALIGAWSLLPGLGGVRALGRHALSGWAAWLNLDVTVLLIGAVAAGLIILLLRPVLLWLFLDARRADRRRRWRELVRQQRRRSRLVIRQADRLEQDLTWIRKLSREVSAEVSGVKGVTKSLGGRLASRRAEERTALALTYAETVRRVRELLMEYSRWAEVTASAYQMRLDAPDSESGKVRRLLSGRDEANSNQAAGGVGPRASESKRDYWMIPSLTIMVDEMDKIPDDEVRTSAVNHLKDLFRIPRVKFVVTVADRYNRFRFRRYGLPEWDRDPYDSAFDDIIEVPPVDPQTATQLLTRRVSGFPAPLALLAYALAAGHPRDMIRFARHALNEFHRVADRGVAKAHANETPAANTLAGTALPDPAEQRRQALADLAEQRRKALETAIRKTCAHEMREFTALLRSVASGSAPLTGALGEWDDDNLGGALVLRTDGGDGSQRPREPGKRHWLGWIRREDDADDSLASRLEQCRTSMKEVLAELQRFVVDYANDPAKGWATPDMVEPSDDQAGENDATWHAYSDYCEIDRLTRARLKIIDGVQLIAIDEAERRAAATSGEPTAGPPG